MSVKAYGEPKYVQKVPAMLFNPKPKVDSAILHIANISKEFFKENNITEEQFFKVLKHGFAQKRKKLTKNLHNQAVTQDSQQDIVNILTKLKIDSNVRAENLTLENWGKLSMYLHN
jgi:16S rRNA (adenine1518-N6/adenine1519-N6)-dimethyltransferase